MNPSIKERWVQALRSGNYVQGTDLLRSKSNEFCCLGVLCDLYIQDHDEDWEEACSACYVCDGIDTEPSVAVQDWAEFYNVVKLIEMNDTEMEPFHVIADYIEANY